MPPHDAPRRKIRLSPLPIRVGLLVLAGAALGACGDDVPPSGNDADTTAASSVPSDASASEGTGGHSTEPGATPSGPETHSDLQPSATPSPPPVCGDILEQTVDAAPWAARRAGIATYHYTADPALGVAHVVLRDDAGRTLGSLEASQRFGEAGIPDGAMVGVLSAHGAERARIVTTGHGVDDAGYAVHALLHTDAGTLRTEARFQNRRCFSAAGDDAPLCAGELDLATGPVLLPSCGVILEQTLHEGRAPVLVNLVYAVEDAGSAPSDAEGVRRVGETEWRTFRAVSGGIPASPEALGAWEAGAALLGDEGLVLLATAWLDRRWWRAIEHHIAHCGVAALPPIDGDDVPLTSVRKRCPGTQNNNAWGSPSSGQASSVWGDPHIVTLDGLAYDLQSTGEFILIRAIDGDPFEVQGRFEALENPALPACGDVSWNTAGATELVGHRISVRSRPAFEITIDGSPVQSAADLPNLPPGASIDLAPDSVTLTWPRGEQVTFQTRSDLPAVGRSLTVDVRLPEHRRGQVRGLLGTFDGNTDTDLVLPDGTLLPQPAAFDALHGRLADAWRVADDASLHDHLDGESASSFLVPGFPAGPVSLRDLPADRVAAARERCAAEGISHPHLVDTCALDAICLDDPRQGVLSANAPLPVAVLPSGEFGLLLSGALALHDPRLPLDTAAPSDPGTCAPWAPSPIAVVPEADRLSLPEPVSVQLAGPGAVSASQQGPTTTLAAGTRVAVHALLRPAPANPDLRQTGTLRFDRPVLGVLLDDAQLPLDPLIEATPSGWSTAGARGLHHPLDRLALSSDRRTLSVTLAGSQPQRLRVLVEAP